MSKKLLSVGVVLALVAAVLVSVPAVSAQSMSLCQTVDALVVAGVIAPNKVEAAKAAAGCSAAVTTTASFTRNLTVGSTGADVTALQVKLGVTPATGYFGAITKAAVVAYQTAHGISATGYVGPLTLASLNAGVVVPVTPVTPVTPVCPAGFTCTSNTGTTVSTTGSEGTITVTQSNSGLASTVYEGDSKVGVLGLKIEAKNSDISVQRVNIDLGTSSSIYTKVLNKIYVMNGSTVLASTDLNSSTVTKDNNNEYYITLTGINLVVAKDSSKVLTVAVDVKDSVGTYLNRVYPIKLYGSQAVRGVDGAGIDQYDGTSSISRNLTVSGALADSSTVKTSLSSASPKATTIVASDGANQDEADKVTTLVFNVKATKSDVTITDLTATTTGTAVTAGQIVTAYLFDGSNELDNSSVNTTTGVATFSNLTIDIAKDATKTLTIKVDVRNASSSALSLTTTVDGISGITAENANGDNVGSQSGSATGETLNVQKAGAIFTLVGTPTLTKTTSAATTTDNLQAIFTFDIAAEGDSVTVASSSAFVVGVYVNGSRNATYAAIYDKPTSGVTQSGTGPYVIADGSSARFVARTSFTGSGGADVTARIESATTDAGMITYISDTFRTNPNTL